MGTILQDLRYAVRQFAAKPGFAAVAVITLALGIGAATAIFSAVNAVFLRALPYPNVDVLGTWVERSKNGARLPSYVTYQDWKAQSTQVDFAYIRGVSLLTPTADGAARTLGAYVTPDFFAVLGVAPEVGRVPSPDDRRDSGGRVAVLSYGFWQRRFGGAPTVVGATVHLNDVPFVVTGVMPREFALPVWADVWMPIEALPASDPALTQRGVHVDGQLIGRLKDGVTWEAASVEVNAIAARLAIEYPAENAGWTAAAALPLNQQGDRDGARRLVTIAVAVGLVLLVACVNLANLLLARGSARGREWAIRLSLGATGGRLRRQVFVESALLAVAGGALGIVAASGGVALLRKAPAIASLSRAGDMSVDGTAMVFTLFLSVITTLVFGTLPAMQAASTNLLAALKDNAAGSGSGAGNARGRETLIVFEVVLSVVLLVGAGLFTRSFVGLIRVDPGFKADHLVAIDIFPPSPKYDSTRTAVDLLRRLKEAAALVPGVRNVGLTSAMPLYSPGIPTPIVVDGIAAEGEDRSAAYRVVSAGYFDTMGITLTRGREFSETEVITRAPVAVVNEAFMRQYLAGSGPLGRSVKVLKRSQARPDFGEPLVVEVVGVSRDVRSFGLEVPPLPEIFLPYSVNPWGHTFLVARIDGDAERVMAALRAAVGRVEPAIPLTGAVRTAGFGFQRVEENLSRAGGPWRFTMVLVGSFAVAALVLSMVGIYGVTAYIVSLRAREMAVRMALGATSGNVLGLIVGRGVRLVVVGTAVGLAVAWAGSAWVANSLYGVAARDPLTFGIAPVIFGLVALIACLVPAWRVTKLEPMAALRAE